MHKFTCLRYYIGLVLLLKGKSKCLDRTERYGVWKLVLVYGYDVSP